MSERTFPVEADVVAVVVAEEVGREQHVVEAGVEDLSLVRRAAFDGNLVEKLGPCAARVRADIVEAPSRGFPC